MRKLLDALYDAAATLAALFMVLLSIVGREVGFYVCGTDAYAGHFMAAAGFLALAHTLKKRRAYPRHAAAQRCQRLLQKSHRNLGTGSCCGALCIVCVLQRQTVGQFLPVQ